MAKQEIILVKRLIAGLFLALFLFIHVVKLTHRHDLTKIVSKEINKGSNVSTSYECSICDYNLTKDSYHFNEFSFFQKQEIAVPSYSFYNTPFITSIGSTSSGRGPPSFS